MSNIILTPYLLFFIDQMDVLFTLMKDGRLLRVKKVDSFANLSVDFRHPLAGVQFDGEKTHIRSSSVDFETEFYETATIFGYGYYPSFNKNNSLFVLATQGFKTKPVINAVTVSIVNNLFFKFFFLLFLYIFTKLIGFLRILCMINITLCPNT